MTITIQIKTDNAAFEENETAEVKRILRRWIDAGGKAGPLFDLNGNRVGAVTITTSESEG